jgi:hypothetical protein
MNNKRQQQTFDYISVGNTKLTMLFLWDVKPCRLIGRYQRFGNILPPSSGLKHWYVPTNESTQHHNPEGELHLPHYQRTSNLTILILAHVKADRIT